MFDAPVTVNDMTFERWVMQNELPVVATFCTPKFAKCRELAPLLDRLARDFAGRLLVTRLEVDDNREWARRLSVEALPTLLFVRSGEIRDRVVALPTWETLRERALALMEGRAPRVPAEPPRAAAPSESGSAGTPVAISDTTFEQVVLHSEQPVLVDFWAPWCGPCRMIAPHLETLAQEMQGRAIIAKLNVDENPRMAGQYGVQSIPTLMIFKQGKLVDRMVGALPAGTIRQRLQTQLERPSSEMV